MLRLELPAALLAGATRILLGGVLLLAAALKGYDLASGRTLAASLSGHRLEWAGLVAGQAAMGLWLVSGLRWQAARWCGAFLFLVFAAVSLRRALAGDASCGCFGRLPVNPWLTFALDLAALLALWLSRPSPAGARRWPALHLAALAGTLAVLATALGLAILRPGHAGSPLWVEGGECRATRDGANAASAAALVEMHPQEWIGAPWSWGEYVDVWPQLKKGNWVVLLYGSHCRNCTAALEEYQALARTWQSQDTRARVALLDAFFPMDAPEAPPTDNSPALRGRLAVPPEWFLALPTLVLLVDGKVVATAQGEEDCRWGQRIFPR